MHTRQFFADIHDGARLLVSGALVELWTRNPDRWSGQLLFPAQGTIEAGERYLLTTASAERWFRVLDVTFHKGQCCVLFAESGPRGSAAPRKRRRHEGEGTNGTTRRA
jgi:hypothetical protein